MRIGVSTEYISSEHWKVMKSMGKVKYFGGLAMNMAGAFIIISLIINILVFIFNHNTLPFYQYILIILVIPALIGVIDAFAQIYFYWKFNYFTYEDREQEINKYKKNYFISAIIEFLIILMVLKISFDGKSLFHMNLFDYIKETIFALIFSFIYVLFYIKREWRKFWEHIKKEART